MDIQIPTESNPENKKSFDQNYINMIFDSYENLKQKTLTDLDAEDQKELIFQDNSKNDKKSHST